MKRLIAIGMIILLCAGCAGAKYYHPTKSEQDRIRDEYECDQIAAQYAANWGYPGNPFIIARESLQCMEIKQGWQRQRQ